MDLIERGARVGTAGFVLARLLLEPPNQALVENFTDRQMRSTWPLQDPDTLRALEAVTPDPYETLPRDHATLFTRRQSPAPLHESAWRPDVVDAAELREELAAVYRDSGLSPPPTDDHVGHQLAFLADLATRIGRAAATGEGAGAGDMARWAQEFRGEHLDRVIDPILQAIGAHARTSLYRALPELVRGFLTAHSALCAAVLAPSTE